MPALQDPVAEYVVGHTFKLLIGGELVDSAGGDRLETRDPSTGRLLTTVPSAGAADVERAYQAAAKAQPEWAALGVAGRGEVLARFAQALEDDAERLAMLDAIDGGMPYTASLADVHNSAFGARQWPMLVRWHGGRTIPASPGNLHYTTYRPYGVCANILPFNRPLLFAATRFLPVVLAGNTTIIKPAPQTSLAALAIGEICREVFPAGVVNVLAGDVAAGDAIVTHPRIKRFAFTGSVATGRKIQERAASVAVKHVSLELGGKNPMIVFPDADVDKAVAGAVHGMNFRICAGQSCGSNSRTYVHRDIYETFLDRLAEELTAIRVGVAYGEGTEMGPLVSDRHRERVRGYIASGREEGVRLLTGGEAPPAGLDGGGYFLAPTLMADVTPQMRVVREEIFGPVMAVAPWSDRDAVIEAANDTDLGLTASIWTNDLSVAHLTAERLSAGYIWINDTSRHYWGTPFGGLGNSGVGREESVEEYESYLELKSIHTILDPAR